MRTAGRVTRVRAIDVVIAGGRGEPSHVGSVNAARVKVPSALDRPSAQVGNAVHGCCTLHSTHLSHHRCEPMFLHAVRFGNAKMAGLHDGRLTFTLSLYTLV